MTQYNPKFETLFGSATLSTHYRDRSSAAAPPLGTRFRNSFPLFRTLKAGKFKTPGFFLGHPGESVSRLEYSLEQGRVLEHWQARAIYNYITDPRHARFPHATTERLRKRFRHQGVYVGENSNIVDVRKNLFRGLDALVGYHEGKEKERHTFLARDAALEILKIWEFEKADYEGHHFFWRIYHRLMENGTQADFKLLFDAMYESKAIALVIRDANGQNQIFDWMKGIEKLDPENRPDPGRIRDLALSRIQYLIQKAVRHREGSENYRVLNPLSTAHALTIAAIEHFRRVGMDSYATEFVELGKVLEAEMVQKDRSVRRIYPGRAERAAIAPLD